MADFSTILNNSHIRAIVQENILERAFRDALYPNLLFRSEAQPQLFPGNVGDSMLFSGVGLIRAKPRPIAPGTDPTPSTYEYEQWGATVQQYADTIDTHMPTSIAAIANLFLRDTHQLGLAAGQTLNRVVRNRLHNAALSGHTVATDPAGGTADQTLSSTSGTLHVNSLNGFTTARRPTLTAGSPVAFAAVSSNNPLPITVYHASGSVAANVTGFTPDNAGDETGPGTLNLTYTSGTYTVTHRLAVLSADRTAMVRVGGGTRVDDLTAGTDLITLASIRAMVARFRQMNVPTHPDGKYHCHLSPTAESEIFADAEFQRLLTSLPDHYTYADFAIGELLGVVFFRNNECPTATTVELQASKANNSYYSTDDPFAGELYTLGGTSVPVQRALFTGQGSIYEYYVDLGQLITEAGVTGKVTSAAITNNGIEVNTQRIQLIIRAPLNRLQDMVSTSYKFIGDWPMRTDVTTGDAARYKRAGVIEFTE